MKFLSTLLSVFLLLVSVAQAQTEFNIRFSGIIDTEAPSTPTLLSATPVSFEQVDISWTAATDNFMLSGYVVLRDGVPVATTTLTSYSDVGLLASTTYLYSVLAFDPIPNYSSSSNSLSATTPDEPVVPPEPPVATSTGSGSQSTATRVQLEYLTVSPGLNSADVLIKTRFPARFEIRWGKTSDYELGYVMNRVAVSEYKTVLTGLEPGTRYMYEVIGYTPFGAETVLEQSSFTTLSPASFWLPTNVSRFSAFVEESDVRLSWGLPPGEFKAVRIVRNHLSYPKHLNDGAVIYEGRGENFTDRGVLDSYSPVYYTAFVVSQSGSVSSGAIARAAVFDENVPKDKTPQLIPKEDTSAPEDTEVLVAPDLPRDTKLPEPQQIIVSQGTKQYDFSQANLSLQAETDFLISIPYGSITERIKTIIVTITDPTDSRKTYSYLLQQNGDSSAYEAVVPVPMLSGQSVITLEIVELSTGVIASYKKVVTFSPQSPTDEFKPLFPDLFFEYVLRVLLVLLVVVVTVVVMYMITKRPDEDNA